jgi:futalosine hydrolase
VHILFAYAAPAEAGSLPEEANDAGGSEFALLGVGKASSSLQLSRRLSREPRPALVVLFGVCGAHVDDADALAVGDICVVGSDCLADEGVQTEDSFLSLDDLGLAATTTFEMDERRTTQAAAMLGNAPIVSGSTVSTCSGNDVMAAARLSHTAAAIETMEGAAVSLVCQELGVPLVQVRCVSNRTGDRSRAGWDLDRACINVQDAVRRLMSAEWQS